MKNIFVPVPRLSLQFLNISGFFIITSVYIPPTIMKRRRNITKTEKSQKSSSVSSSKIRKIVQTKAILRIS